MRAGCELLLLAGLAVSLTRTAAALVPANVSLAAVDKLNNDSLFWGPYRPGLYFGVRPRASESLQLALLWSQADRPADLAATLRHTCEQRDGMLSYGWDEYDARTGGRQTFQDASNAIDLSTSWLKLDARSWLAHVAGTPREEGKEDPQQPHPKHTMLVLYVTHDTDLLQSKALAGERQGVALSGKDKHLGPFKLAISTRDQTASVAIQSLTLPADVHWQAKAIVSHQLQTASVEAREGAPGRSDPAAAAVFPPHEALRLIDGQGSGNTQIVQFIFEGKVELDVHFSPDNNDDRLPAGKEVRRKLEAVSKDFHRRFDRVFRRQPPYAGERYAYFAQSLYSNLAGGWGFWSGKHLVDRSEAAEYEEEEQGFAPLAAAARRRARPESEGPLELFSGVPSRAFFPRGFLWDEGFHLLPLVDWDMAFALDGLRSWYKLQDSGGWLARELILGPEARSKVPAEFQVQSPRYANPPTLFFIVDELVGGLEKQLLLAGEEGSSTVEDDDDLRQVHLDQPAVGIKYLAQLYPFLRRHLLWIRRTQGADRDFWNDYLEEQRAATGATAPAKFKLEAYRWRGRTETHLLPSGLDDYPRPQPADPSEAHVDLLSWVGMMVKSLEAAAGLLYKARDLGYNVDCAAADSSGGGSEGEESANSRHCFHASHIAAYRGILDNVRHSLTLLHWSEDAKMFCDVTDNDNGGRPQAVCHKGYLSLLPFLTGMLDPDERQLDEREHQLGHVLQMIGNERELWSPHGLRSLSKSDRLYGTGENYWRGPVWLNINYMALVKLRHTALRAGPHRATAGRLYSQLRRRLVDTVYQSWAATGFAWEQYNAETGQGQRTQHFTGWTSLVVKIMAMEESLDGQGERVADEL